MFKRLGAMGIIYSNYHWDFFQNFVSWIHLTAIGGYQVTINVIVSNQPNYFSL